MKNLPKSIFLQIDPDNVSDENTDFKELEGVTWCEERVNETDVEYVLASDYNDLKDELVKQRYKHTMLLKEQKEQLEIIIEIREAVNDLAK